MLRSFLKYFPAIVILAVLLPLSGSGQQYGFIHYSIRDGLAQSQVRDIFQDSKGFLWFCTLGGASRFDGHEFKNFSQEGGLIRNEVYDMLEDKHGNLWFASVGGVTKFDGTTFTAIPLPDGYEDTRIWQITEAPDGSIWMGSDGTGAFRYKAGTFKVYGAEDGLLHTYVRAVYCGKSGRVWLGTRRGGLYYFENDSIKELPISVRGAKLTNISNVLEDKASNVWVTTFGDGVIKYDGTNFINFRQTADEGVAGGLISRRIRAIVEDAAGNIWFGSRFGISKYDGKEFTNISEADGLNHENIRSMFVDNEDNLWLGTDGTGVLKFTGEQFVTYTTADGLCSNFIMSVLEDKDGNYWFSSFGAGICKFDGKRYTSYTNPLNTEIMWCSLEDSKGRIWFGSSLGAAYFDGKTVRRFEGNSALVGQRVTSIAEDSNGQIWFGTEEGLSVFDGNKIQNYNQSHDRELDGSAIRNYPQEDFQVGAPVRSILEDPSGHLWFGTATGVSRYNGTTFEKFTVADNLSDDNIYSLLTDHKKNLWLGTGNGLTFFDGEKFKPLKISENYSSNFINFLVLHAHELWIGTNNGVFTLDLDHFYKTGKQSFKAFNTIDGIPSPECNLNSGLNDSKGNIWFGTNAGMVLYNPSKRKVIDNLKPYIHISAVRLFMQNADFSRFSDSIAQNTGLPVGLKLTHKNNHLTFDYTGISHGNPEGVRYQFMLEGNDQDWLPITKANFATYSNVPHGEYSFKVRAINNDGNWSENIASFSFVILPPFYLTWWFYLLCAAFLIGTIWMIYRWRTNVRARKEATQQLVYKSKMLDLEQQTLNSSMNRHFVFNALNSIQYYINRNDKQSANKYLTSFAKLIRKNLDSSTVTHSTLADELERLRLYLELEHMRFHNKFSYIIEISPEVNSDAVKIPAMLLQPYVENSIWHGILPSEKKGEVSISVSAHNSTEVEIVIEDNGVGVDTSLNSKTDADRTHISKGTEITTGRINLLRKMTNKNMYIDGPRQITDANNNPIGTRVKIVMANHHETTALENA